MSELTRPHWGGGLLLLLVVALLLAVPLWKLSDANHPLARAEQLDLCALLPAPPFPLGAARHPGNPLTPVCLFMDAQRKTLLTVSFSGTRQMSLASGEAADTEKMFATWMLEVRASYQNGNEVAGPWRHAFAWKMAATNSLLFEDRGVMVVLESTELDPAALQAYARQVQAALRQEK